MLNSRRTVSAICLAVLAAAGVPALAQQENSVGPPVIRDFQLPGERRVQARPQQVEPTPTPVPPAAQRTAPAAAPQPGSREQPPRERPAAGARSARPAPERALPSQPQDMFQLPQAAPEAAAPPAPAAQEPAATIPAPAPAEGWPFHYYLVPIFLLGLVAALMRSRRRRSKAIAVAAVEAEAAPPPPRPAPVARPWLEIELKAERAASTDSEASVDFELVLHNNGKSVARHIRVNARMLNAGREQDKEIGAFFRTKGEGRKTHPIGDLPPGERGLIQGSVAMPREEMRALQVNEQLLFIPVLAVNVLYDWGEGRTGQSSKSYVVGREIGEASQKMGAFRLDLGPRIYRTVGQREHSLAKRV